MAELRVGAPLASDDTEDDWTGFTEQKFANFVSSDDRTPTNENNIDNAAIDDIFSVDGFLEKGKSESLEDLVKTFDKRLSQCFGNYEDSVASLAPVQTRSQEDVINGCQTWLTLTGTYGNALPIDWSKCYLRELQTKSLHLKEYPQRKVSENLDLSDDEELKEALDVHAIISPIVPRETDDINADDVIQEIDTIMKMQDSISTDDTGYITETDMLNSAESDMINFKDTPSPSSRLHMTQADSAELLQLSIKSLNDIVDELQTEIDIKSSVLVQELASRDDIIYERELKNSFIALCHKVMKKKKPVETKERRKGRLTDTATYVVPYQLSQMPPSNELLQVYIRILKAIYEDNPNVPAMLTDYILKVVCPTS